MILRNLNLVDGDGKRLGAGDIRIAGRHIAAIGPALPADGEPEHDFAGRTAVPSFFNAHTHLWSPPLGEPYYERIRDRVPETAIRMAGAAARALHAGVTTLRDAGTPHRVDIAVKRMIDAGEIPGPFMHASGQYMCITGGHGHHVAGHEADGPDAMRKATREELKAGASVVKIIATGGVITEATDPGAAQMNEDEIRAVVEEAHKAGRRVMAHAEGADGILWCVRAGVDSIEHGFWLTDETIELMLERGTYFTPTLSANERILEHGVAAGIPRYVIDKMERCQDDRIDSFQRAVRAGVRITCGTDAGTPFNPVEDTAAEMVYMVQYGMSPAQALATTGQSAAAMGLDDRGYLRAGMVADVVVLAGDPLRNIHHVRNVEAVFHYGERVR